MKICKKCNTKNDNRKKKCTYCGASLQGIKIKEESKIYKATYKGIYDIMELEKSGKTVKRLSEQFFFFVVTFFIIHSCFNTFAYYFVDLHFNNVEALIPSFIYQGLKGLLLNTVTLVLTFLLVFWKQTIYEIELSKFLVVLGLYFSLYSAFLGAINFMQYGSLDLAFLTFGVNALIFFIYLPIIHVILKEKLC